MQNTTAARLTRKIRSLRAKTPPASYREICLLLGIYTEDGKPDPGLAKKIEQGFEPTKDSTRQRIGLSVKRVRKPYHPDDAAMHWWRNSLRSGARRKIIRQAYDESKGE